jgi:enamine deaminase RidA (YjgF/YER057c/UK114 family)
MTPIQLLSPAGLVSSPAFSQVAVVPPGATTVYVGGQNAVDETGTVVGVDDVATQTSKVMANLEAALAGAGMGMGNLLSVSVLLVAGSDLRAVYRAAAKAFAGEGPPPLVGVAMVAGLAVPGALVEVSAIAAAVR